MEKLICHLCGIYFLDNPDKNIYEDGNIYCPKCCKFVEQSDKTFFKNNYHKGGRYGL